MRRSHETRKEIIEFLAVAVFALLAALFWAPESHAQIGDRVIGTQAGLCHECWASQGFKVQNVNIYGDDDRTKPSARYENQTPMVQALMDAVGEIFCTDPLTQETVSLGTASVVGDGSKILTVRHVFFNKAGKPHFKNQECDFVRHDYKTGKMGAYLITPDQTPNVPTKNDNSNEFLIIKLRSKVKNVHPLHAKLIDLNKSNKFRLIGFNSDLIDVMSGAQVTIGNTDILPNNYVGHDLQIMGTHKADGIGGTSGGPLIDFNDNQVIGLQVGGGEFNEFSIFLRFTPIQVAEINQ